MLFMNKLKLFLPIFTFVLFGVFGAQNASAEVISTEAPYIEVSSEGILIQEVKNTDVFVIADNINVEKEIAGDFFAIGKKITINSPINGNARLIAEQITINAPINGSLTYLANNVYVSSLGEIEKDAYGFTNKFILDGRVGRNLNLNTDTNSNSKISGKVIGNLYFSGNKPEILDGSFVNGQVIETLKTEKIDSSNRFDQIFSKMLHSLTMILVGFLLIKFSEKKITNLVSSYKTSFTKNILVGFASIILIPLISAILMITIIAFPIGLFTLFSFIFVGYFGYVIPALVLGQKVFENKKSIMLQLIAGVLLLDILTMTPYIGSPLSILIVVSSIGLVVNKILLNFKSKKSK